MRSVLRVFLGIIAHVPILGVFAVAFWMVGQTGAQPLPPVDVDSGTVQLPAQTQHAFAVMMGACTVIALFQMLSSIAFIIHAVQNVTISSAFKVVWCLLVVFVGSIAQPLYFWFYVFPKPRDGGHLAGAPHPAYPPPGYHHPPY